MTCPKCGAELIINSNVCPNCDVANAALQGNKKKKLRLKLWVKIALALLVLIAAIAAAITVRVHYQRLEIHGINNGNRLNSSLVCETVKNYYFSSGKELYCTDKRFENSEMIDSSDRIIANVIDCNGSVYYTKDSGIYSYNPSSRKIKAVARTEDECSVVAKSYYDIYYSGGSSLYRLSTRDLSFVKITDGIPAVYESTLYLLTDRALYSADFNTLEKTKIADVSEYSKPAFIKDGKLFCYDYKEPKVFSVRLEDGAQAVEFKPENYKNVSDVTHINVFDNYLFLRGENGIYRYDFDTGEILSMTSLGYMEYINVYSGGLYAVSPENKALFVDVNGNIIAEEDNNN